MWKLLNGVRVRICWICGTFLEEDEGLTMCVDCKGLTENLKRLHMHGIPIKLTPEQEAQHQARIQAQCDRIEREFPTYGRASRV